MSKFQPGKSGNPKGRPKGRTLQDRLRKAVGDRFDELVRSLIDRALDGDTAAANCLLSRVVPILKPVQESARMDMSGSLQERTFQVLEAISRGEVSPADGKTLLESIHLAARVKEATETSRQIELLALHIENTKTQQ